MASVSDGLSSTGRPTGSPTTIERAQERMIGRSHHGSAYAVVAFDWAYDRIAFIEHGHGHAGLFGYRFLKPQ
jgi:hypothetical protein